MTAEIFVVHGGEPQGLPLASVGGWVIHGGKVELNEFRDAAAELRGRRSDDGYQGHGKHDAMRIKAKERVF